MTSSCNTSQVTGGDRNTISSTVLSGAYHHGDGVSTNRPFKWQCRHRELPALIHPPLSHHRRGAMVPASPIYSPLTRGPAFRLVRTLLWWPLPGAGKLAAGGWAWFPQTKAISGTFFLPKCDFPFYFFFLSLSLSFFFSSSLASYPYLYPSLIKTMSTALHRICVCVTFGEQERHAVQCSPLFLWRVRMLDPWPPVASRRTHVRLSEARCAHVVQAGRSSYVD